MFTRYFDRVYRFTLRRAILALLAFLLVIAVIAGDFIYVNYQVNNASAYM